MKNIFLLAFLLLINFSFSQKINLEEIRQNVTNINSIYQYDKLVKDFQTQPSVLKSDSLKTKYLYYGKLYSGYYKKSAEGKSGYLKFVKLTGAKKYSKAIKLGEEIVSKDPINLVVLMNLITCYKNTKENEERLKKLELQVEILLTTIARYGDGRSKETSFKVISIGDEYSLLNYFNINFEKYHRTSEGKGTDAILDIWTKNENYKEDHRNKIYVTVFSNTSKISIQQ